MTIAKSAREDKYFLPYFEAVRKVVNGTAVENLEKLRKEGNTKFVMDAINGKVSLPKKNDEFPRGYNPLDVVISFAADAENKILQGVDAEEAYKFLTDSGMKDARQRTRKMLEDFIEHYFD